MGFLSNLFDGFFGDADAPKDAAAQQRKYSEQAIAETRRAREQARADLKPFADMGRATAPGLQQLVTDPNAQRDYIQSNPFFKTLADDAQNRIFSNQAARGKLGSGETAKALQNSMMLLGNDLVSQNIGQRQNLTTMGANAASGQASTTVNAGAGIGNLLTGIGNANAAGIIGSQNQKAMGAGNLVGTALGAYKAHKLPDAYKLSDARAKTDIRRIGQTTAGVPLYRFRYIGSDDVTVGVMAQELRKTNPGAVVDIDGLLHVDYSRVN